MCSIYTVLWRIVWNHDTCDYLPQHVKGTCRQLVERHTWNGCESIPKVQWQQCTFFALHFQYPYWTVCRIKGLPDNSDSHTFLTPRIHLQSPLLPTKDRGYDWKQWNEIVKTKIFSQHIWKCDMWAIPFLSFSSMNFFSGLSLLPSREHYSFLTAIVYGESCTSLFFPFSSGCN